MIILKQNKKVFVKSFIYQKSNYHGYIIKVLEFNLKVVLKIEILKQINLDSNYTKNC